MMAITALKKLVPPAVRRRAQVWLVDHGLLAIKPRGAAGVTKIGHREYVGRASHFDEIGALQLDFLKRQGLRPGHVLYDIACGSLRAGRHFIPYLDRGHYLGMEGEEALIEMGLKHEIDPAIVADKAPQFVISYEFAFDEFSRSPDYAIAASLFTHLNEDDIRLCLSRLAARVEGECQLFATFFKVDHPTPNFRRSHPHLGFCYTTAQMEAFGADAGWSADYVGDLGWYKKQKVMRYTIRR